jgi:hypothetical protein
MKNIPGKISWTTSDVPDNVNDRIPEGGDGSTPPHRGMVIRQDKS